MEDRWLGLLAVSSMHLMGAREELPSGIYVEGFAKVKWTSQRLGLGATKLCWCNLEKGDIIFWFVGELNRIWNLDFSIDLTSIILQNQAW